MQIFFSFFNICVIDGTINFMELIFAGDL